MAKSLITEHIDAVMGTPEERPSVPASILTEHIDAVMGTPDEQPSGLASALTEHIDAVMSSYDLSDSLRLTVGTNPDEAAKAKRLSRELDIPEGILPPLPVAEQEAYLKRLNPDQLKQETPATANFLTNPDNARIVGRDVESLAKMEKTVLTSEQFTERVREIRKENPTLSIDEARTFAKLYPDSGKPKARSTTEAVLKDPLKAAASGVNRFGATMIGVQRMNPLGEYHPGAVAVSLAQRAVEVLAPSLYKDPRQLEEDVRAGLLQGEDYWAKQKSEDIQTRVEKFNQAGALESVKMLLTDPGLMVDQLSQSAVYILPSMAYARGGVAATYAGKAVMEALDAALTAREEAREAGLTFEEQDRAANTAALITALIAFLGNKLARTGVLETEFFTKGTIGGSLLEAIVREGIAGGVEEAGNTFGVNVSAQTYYDPTRQLLQGVPKSFAVGSVLEATHGAGMSAVSNVVGATAVKLNRAIENHARQEAQARRAQDRFGALRELSAQATENGVRTRSAETFREFVDTMTEGQNLEAVYVAPATLRAALADPAIPLDQITSRFPELMTAMQNAEQSGTDVEIATADYLTYLAGTPVEEKIIQELRTEPGGMTYSEANTFYQEQRKVFEEAAAAVVEEVQPVLTRQQFERARTAQDETVPAARGEGEPQGAPDTDIIQQAETYEEYLELHKNKEAVRRVQRAEVETALLNDMRKLGKFPASMNRAYVAPLVAFYETQAREMGISPRELYNRRPLRVTGTNFDSGTVVSQTTPATPADFRPDKVADILKKDNWAILTAENPNNQPLPPEENAARMAELLGRLQAAGFEHMVVEGFYNRHENSVVVFGISQEEAVALGREFEQESVLTREGFVYQDGSITPTTGDVEVFDVAPDNNYTIIRFPDGAVSRFAIGLDFNTRIQPGEVRPIPAERIGALDQTQTPEFKRWFGDSKVVDAEGRPLVVYHGTNQNVEQFLGERRGANTNSASSRGGFFFTQDATEAGDYANMSARKQVSNAIEAERNAERLLKAIDRAYDKNDYDLAEKLTIELEESEQEAMSGEERGANILPVYLSIQNPMVFDMSGKDLYDMVAAIDNAKKKGHDGLRLDNVRDPVAFRGGISETTQWVAFRPEQVKSAIGNNGQFDPANPNIVLQNNTTGRVSVTGHHFSRAPHEILSGAYYGTGYKGAEATRVADASDPRIKNRLYFYVDEGKGVFPEDGVGRWKHTVPLTNLYDGARNPLRLPTKNEYGVTDMNVFETAVIDAGFDGYYVEGAFHRQGAVVLLGDATKSVRVPQPAEMYQSGRLRSNQGSVEERFWQRLEDFDAAVADYEALPGSRGGKVLDVDVARELSEDYLADRTRASEVHEPASAFIKRLFAKKLAEAPQAGEKPVVLFTAGGGGAGKSTAIQNATSFLQESQIVYDGTLANYESAKTKIEQALAAGKEVQIALVVREPVEALTNGVLSRAMEQAAEHGTGRVVKADAFIDAHAKAPQTVQRLAADYANDPRVHIVAFDNITDASPVEINVADATKYVYNDLDTRVYEALRRAYEEGRITQEVYDAVRTPTDEGVPSGVREGVREGVEGGGQEQSSNTVEQGPRGSYNLDQLVISLLQGANWSTMIHESGHFFLEGLFATARMPEATPRMKEDAQKVLDWFGVTQEQWDSFDIEQKRPLHEQWAQSFERWAFEGVAPSLKLQPIFSRFMAWMKEVYKSMEDFLRLNPLAGKLNDEIRDVFGRLMASEQLIREAQDARSYAPLFKTAKEAEEAGVPRSKFEAYMERAREVQDESIGRMQARSLRDMKWLNNAQSARLKELQQQANGLRKQIREEVTKQVMAEPVNQAKTFLRYGKLTDPQTGEVVEASTGHKISTDVLAALYPDGNPNNPDLSKLRGMTAKDGADPDVIAPMFGFQSGDQMVRAIASAENVQAKIEGLTDQRMLEEHGELVDERAIQRAVEESLHTEARARFMATGLTLLTKVGNVQQIMRAAKETAERVIGGKRVRDLKPAQYTAAETRANKEAIKAAAKNPQRAAEAQRAAILNNRLAKAALEAEAEVDSALRYLKKFTREGTRKNLDTDYLEQIDSLLEPFDLRTGTTLRAIDSRTSLRDWMAQQEALGFEPIIDPELVAEARQKHYKNMTMDELRTLVDTVKSIEHLGRLKKKLLTAQDARDFQTRIAEARDSIARNANRTVKEKPTPNDALGRFGQFVRRMGAGHRKFASFIRELDGGKDLGVMANLLLYPMYEAGSLETDLRMKAAQDVDNLFAPIYSELKQLGGLYSRRLNIPGTDFSLTTEERIMFALNWSNEGNRQRLLDGGIAGKRALTLNDVQAVLDTLTREEWQFVQGVLDYFETYRPMIAEQERMLTGKTPEWVEPAEIETKFGTLRGGYFPAKYDTNLSTRSEILEAAVDLRQAMKGAFNRAGTRNGYAQQRAEAVKNRPLLLSFDVISRHVHEVTHRLAWQAWLVDASRVLDALDPDIRQHLGVEALQAMREHVRDVAQGDAPVTGTTDVVLKRIRTGTSIVGMGYRVATALLQPAGITQSWARLGIANIMNGIVETVKNPAAAYAFIMENSAFMRNRGKTMNREINEIVNQVRAGKKLSALQASYFFMITKMQLLVDIPTYLGAYNKALSDLGYEQATSAEQRAKIEKKAHSFAGQTVIDTQTGGEIKDLSNVQKGGQGQKLFTNFYSFFSALYNLNVENFRTKKLTDPVQFADFVATAMLLNVVPAIYSVILRNILKGECDWDDGACLANRYKTEQMGMVFGQIIGVRELGAAVDVATGGDYFGSYGPPSMRFFSEAMKLGVQLEQGDADMALFKAANNTAGIVFHYPAGQINTTLEGMLAIENGEVEGADMIGALISGPPR